MARKKEELTPKNYDAWLKRYLGKSLLEKLEFFSEGEKDKLSAKDEEHSLLIYDGLINRTFDPKKTYIPPTILRVSLCSYAKIYCEILEVVSTSPPVYKDLSLQQYYFEVVQQIKYLLSYGEFKGFTGKFNPPEHILPSSNLGIKWKEGIASETESFLASAQGFLGELRPNLSVTVVTVLVIKKLYKTIEPILKKIEEHRQQAKQYHNDLRNHQRKKEQSGGQEQNPAETGGNAKRLVSAVLISSIMILLFELSVYFGPITWVKNHPRSYGIQGSVICLIPCLIFGFLKPRWRKWCWGTAAIAFLVGLLSLL
jgi:hypothetical protein